MYWNQFGDFIDLNPDPSIFVDPGGIIPVGMFFFSNPVIFLRKGPVILFFLVESDLNNIY